MTNTKTKLPPYRKDVLVWHPKSKYWVIGNLIKNDDKYGDFFAVYGSGAWYLCDGHTHWQYLPKKPVDTLS